MTKKGLKKGLKSGGYFPKLTHKEAETLQLIINEFLTVKQVAIRRGCSVQAVYKLLNSLKKKGVIGRGLKRVEFSRGTFKPFEDFKPNFKGKYIRLHGQEFNIKILFKDSRYKENIGKLIYIDGNSIKCYRDSIEVYSGQSFYGENPQRATAESITYFQRLFIKLENQLNIHLIKPRKENIKLVRNHYAEIDNELATESERKGERVRIYATEDNKLWFTIDNSFNLHEAEFQHTQTAKQDTENLIKHFNDIRDKNPPKLSEIMILLNDTININKETASGLNILTKLIKPNITPKEKEISAKIPEYIG